MSLGGLEEVASARTCFAEFLLSISNCPAYFFVISGGEEDQLSLLCNRYNLSAFEFDAFLIVCNLVTLNSRSSTVVIKHDEWEDFIMEHGLSDIVQKIGHTKFDLQSLAGTSNIQGQVEKAADGEKKRMRKHCRVALQVILACQYTILLWTTILCLTE